MFQNSKGRKKSEVALVSLLLALLGLLVGLSQGGDGNGGMRLDVLYKVLDLTITLEFDGMFLIVGRHPVNGWVSAWCAK